VVARTHVGVIYVSGLVTGELDGVVLRDRKLLSRDGVVVVTIAIDAESGKLAERPRITTRGFVDAGEGQALIEKGRDVVLGALENGKGGLISKRHHDFDRSFVDAKVKNSLSKFFYERIHRRPIIIPVVVEVKRKS
jgi:ribonuclease J